MPHFDDILEDAERIECYGSYAGEMACKVETTDGEEHTLTGMGHVKIEDPDGLDINTETDSGFRTNLHVSKDNNLLHLW